jgi:hypothetical protein
MKFDLVKNNGLYGIGKKFIYDYTHKSLPKLEELVDSTVYDAVFSKFIQISQKYLNELKNSSNSTSIIIKSERVSYVEPIAIETSSKKRTAVESIDCEEKSKKKIKKSKKLVKVKKSKKKCSEVCNTTADMVDKNQAHISVTSELTTSIIKKKKSSTKLLAKKQRSSLRLKRVSTKTKIKTHKMNTYLPKKNNHTNKTSNS